MAKVDVTKQIDAAPEKVWALLANPSSYPDWLTIHDGWRGEPPTEVSVGSTFTEMCTVMGMTNKIDWTVTECEVPRALKISGTGLAGAKISFTMSVGADGDGSSAAIDAEFEGQMVVGAIGKAIERSAGKEVEASLDKLAALVS
ncbi:SRPBCC family protein [Skermania piniformis]|uniref:SRPBCC family protein n=1 Tax=Skermania pinensis TaxID=39122 RepID=A0ABX8S6W6_9ACTN|nr:SRPBCC family protein [Skermania piniformis]QXQ13578.1 SRPBCC family protein [Skermania piniformis]